jgi:alkylation response protein AidB-like acyl-CoA dehydrogenase
MAARDVDHGVDRGERWMPQLSALKSRATETALHVVEQAVRVAGGSAYFSSAELSRLYRDVLAGLFHPTSDRSLHASWANLLLGPLP